MLGPSRMTAAWGFVAHQHECESFTRQCQRVPDSEGGCRMVRPDNQESQAQERLRATQVRFASLGIEFASGIAGFVLLGWMIDRALHSTPIAIIAAAATGCVAGLYVLIRRSYEMQKEFERTRARADSAHDQVKVPSPDDLKRPTDATIDSDVKRENRD